MKADNFDPELHQRSYLDEFREKRITADSLITTERNSTERLDGVWTGCPDPYQWLLRIRGFEHPDPDKNRPYDYDFDFWERFTLPVCWNMAAPQYYWYEGSFVFTRKFSYRPLRSKERVFLRFDGVQYCCYLFLNGTCLGFHEGGSTAFSVEITEEVVFDNRLIIVVENNRLPSRVPMDNTDWFNYGGIYRSIEMIRTPKTYIKDLFIRLKPDGKRNTLQLDCQVEGPESDGVAQLEIKRLGKIEIPILNGRGQVENTINPRLWSPEDPYLYDLTMTYRDDRVVDRVGFREILINGRDILLNGQPILLKGISLHEDDLEDGKKNTPEKIRQRFQIAREGLGVNFIRLAHYPHTQQALRLADETGLLVWSEIPVYWAIAFENRTTYLDAENQLTEMILRDRNRASVIIWSVGNENPDTDERLAFMSALVDRAKLLDPTRSISAACLVNKKKNRIEDRLAEKLDLIGLNEYFGWYEPAMEKFPQLLEQSQPDKPVVITEFGAGALYGHHGTLNELFTEEHQENLYREQTRLIEKSPYIKGISPWILQDFRTPHRMNQFQKGYNRKGLISEKMEYKKAFYVLKDFYTRWNLKPVSS